MQDTKYFLHGGDIGNFLERGMVADFFQEPGCRHILYIGFHHQRYDLGFIKNIRNSIAQGVKFTVYEKGSAKNSINQLSTIDGVYIGGGNEQELLTAFDEDNFREPFVKWLKSGNAKAYVGSSAGVQVLGKKYYSWEEEVKDWDTAQDNGFGIFENSLFEVHVTQRNRRFLIDKAIREESDIKHIYGIDEGSAIVLQVGKEDCPEIIEGGAYVYKK